MSPNVHHRRFPIMPFCAYLYPHNMKTKGARIYKDVLPIKRLLYYWRYLFSGLELYVRYDLLVIDPKTHHNHYFRYYILCVHTLIIKKLQVVYRRSILIERVLYYQSCLFSMLELNVRYRWPVMAPNTHHSLFLISDLCALHEISVLVSIP